MADLAEGFLAAAAIQAPKPVAPNTARTIWPEQISAAETSPMRSQVLAAAVDGGAVLLAQLGRHLLEAGISTHPMALTTTRSEALVRRQSERNCPNTFREKVARLKMDSSYLGTRMRTLFALFLVVSAVAASAQSWVYVYDSRFGQQPKAGERSVDCGVVDELMNPDYRDMKAAGFALRSFQAPYLLDTETGVSIPITGTVSQAKATHREALREQRKAKFEWREDNQLMKGNLATNLADAQAIAWTNTGALAQADQIRALRSVVIQIIRDQKLSRRMGANVANEAYED